ncbi:MAG: thioester reductase domain-containing protein [Deltaproteobacteria bacterium]|nr:thioester reductase domain-containing protein [Deltaproteobacteria bacterium]MBW2156226.1 thioester reductase domain-containing protein [Deltaproteobacteria bacterium]MBW2326221.1 thioester reductase domain-containing protein [Deltaproteobacteria bacterium]
MKIEQLCLHQLFQDQAERTPEAVAVVDGDKTLTYRELDRTTDELAGFLQNQGVAFDETVGIFMETCMEYLVAYIAILKAGGAYIPLELAYPDALLEKIFDEAQPKVIVTKRQYRNRFNSDLSAKPLFMDVDDTWRVGIYDKDAVASISLENLAFIAYTSGTTGEPKGVLVPHRAVVHSYTSRYEQSSYQPQDRVACNIFFVWEILRPLLKGATCYIIPDDIIYDPRPLLDYLAGHKITEVLFTPSLLETVINSVDAEQIRLKLSSLKAIWLNGEVVTVNLKNRVLKILPDHVRLLNTYSISECHDVADVDLRDAKDLPSGICTVGHTIQGVELKLLDEKMQPVFPGGVGELYIGGPCLAKGYLKKPDLTAERFVLIEGQRFYRTGDLAEIHAGGKLEIKGRCDFMVKIRGYSIHLGAVETALLEHANVKSCAVIAEGEEGEDKRLVAYVVRHGAADWEIDERTGTSVAIRNILKLYLPHYMIPSTYIELDNIPLHPITGKLNYKLLPSPPPKYQHDFSDIQLGQGASLKEQENIMRTLWERILFLDPNSIKNDSSFFDFGGHSLLAVELTIFIEEIFRIQLMVKDVYEYPTVTELVKFMNNDAKDVALSVSIKEDAFLEPSIIPATDKKPIKLNDAVSILVTGTTGFLGAFLLDELLKSTKDHVKIYCLVRIKSGDQTDAINRVVKNLKYYHLWNDNMKNRIVPVVGDLTKKYFGLSVAQFNELAQEIDFIFHCASLVNYVYSYSIIKPAAVNGTQEILRLACTSTTKPIHYISTNGIFAGEDKEAYLENNDIDSYADHLTNGYGQAKWVAEKLVWEAVSRGLPVCLYRPGNIGHHSGTGVTNPSDFQSMIIDACAKVKCVPDKSDWAFELTPVDLLVKSIVLFASNPSCFGQVFNIVQNDPVPSKTVFDLLFEMKLVSEYVSFDEWKSRLYTKAEKEGDYILNVLAQSLEDVEMYLKDECIYDCSRFENCLTEHGIQRPLTDSDYFKKLIDTLV